MTARLYVISNAMPDMCSTPMIPADIISNVIVGPVTRSRINPGPIPSSNNRFSRMLGSE